MKACIALHLIAYFNIQISYAYSSLFLTGSSGVLGSAIIKLINSRDATLRVDRLHLGYRNKNKVNYILENFNLNPNIDVSLVHMDFGLTPIPDLVDCDAGQRILINNAGLLKYGNSIDNICEQILVNAIYPITLADKFLAYKEDSLQKSTVINVSSGDGESMYINPDLWNELSNISTLDGLYGYIKTLISKENKYLESNLCAYGDSPGYSLSKAILNIGTKLLHSKHCSHRPLTKVISVCPGNFDSPISSPSDRVENSSDFNSAPQSPDEAARHVINAVVDICYESGKFYRFGHVIEW